MAAKLKNGQKLQIRISRQGGPIVEEAMVRAIGPNVAAVSLNLTSKYVEVPCVGCGGDKANVPMVVLGSGARSLGLTEGKEKDWTEVEFPDLVGWNVFAVDSARYTVNICFTNENALTKAFIRSTKKKVTKEIVYN